LRDNDGAPLIKELGNKNFSCIKLLELISSATSSDVRPRSNEAILPVKILHFKLKEDGELELKLSFNAVEPKNTTVFILENHLLKALK
jgi:hypothetical protein